MKIEPIIGRPNLMEIEGSQPGTILVADDEPVNLSLIKRRLQREGYTVITAKDGREAVDMAQKNLPDLIILDIMMPGLNGLQACKILKEDDTTRDISVIFLSALDETDIIVNGLSLGANDYLSKPFKAEELLARARVAIRLKRERDALRKSVDDAKQRAEDAQEMSMSDALTGLLNRHGLQRALLSEYASSRRYARPLSCLMIDVDKFKSINDTYGHPVGDITLAQVASVLSEAVRASDIVCRCGGEEFLVLMPETHLEGASSLGEKIRGAAAASVFGNGNHLFSLTLSVGAAELYESESGNDMVARADAALYNAKQRGRNRVEVAF